MCCLEKKILDYLQSLPAYGCSTYLGYLLTYFLFYFFKEKINKIMNS